MAGEVGALAGGVNPSGLKAVGPGEGSGGEGQPGCGIRFDHVGWCSPGVPGSFDALHGPERCCPRPARRAAGACSAPRAHGYPDWRPPGRLPTLERRHCPPRHRSSPVPCLQSAASLCITPAVRSPPPGVLREGAASAAASSIPAGVTRHRPQSGAVLTRAPRQVVANAGETGHRGLAAAVDSCRWDCRGPDLLH